MPQGMPPRCGAPVPHAACPLLMKPNPTALAVFAIVIDPHVDHGRDPREGVAHQSNQRAVAKAYNGIGLDRVEKHPRLLSPEDRRLAALHYMLRPADRSTGIHGE